MISTRWPLPSSGEEVCLLESENLRNAYGKSIGRIAHSHHWNIERVNAALRESVGAATQLPTDWVVNEKKIACLLRCADAAHIDHRRAPSMLYALSKPKGNSDKHWRFQHKLNKVTRVSDALVFLSGQDFNLEEAPAWWLWTPSGECVGRAALWMFSEGNFRFRDLPNSVSVGGFVYPGASEFEYVGVLAGDTVEVRRGTAVRDVPKQLLAKWATNQARLIEAEKFQIADLMGHATRSSSWGVIPWASRSAFVAEVSLHFLNLKRLVSAKSSIYVPVDRTYDDNLKFVRNL